MGDTAIGPTVLPFTRADIERTIPARFEQAAAHFSDHIALTGRGRTWTYRDLNEQANRIAHAIRRQVPSDAECVAQLIDQSPGMVVAALAAMKAGCASLAIHPAMPARAQSRILEDAGPALLLASTATEGRARELASGRWPVVNLDVVDDRWPRSNPARTTGPGEPRGSSFTRPEAPASRRAWSRAIERSSTGCGCRRSTTESRRPTATRC